MTRRKLLRLDLPQAIVLALLIHLLLMVLGEMRPGWLPWAFAAPEVPPEPQPLRFEFVDLPKEPPTPEKPPERAPASDRTRRVATPVPPKEAPPSPDPYSQGNTSERILYDASPELRPNPGPASEPAQPSAPTEPTTPGERQASTERSPVSPEGKPSQAPTDEEARKAQALIDATKPFALRELGQRYDHMAAPVNADFGDVSFDTVGIDWGPYAKEMLEIIRRNWIERLPPAFQAGLRGRSVVSFRIATDGGVSKIVLVASSDVRPYDMVAQYAIEASGPLPPLPPAFLDLGHDDVGVTIGFYYNLRPPD